MNKQFQRAGLALAAAGLLALTGCGTSTVSKGITDDGQAGEVVFPDIEKSAWLKEGTFPNLDSLRLIAPGVTKDQLYDLVGRPHFREGLVSVREWDYIFNFRTPAGVKVCQFKAILDKDLLAQSFHWQPADCANLLRVAPPVERVVERTVAAPPPPPPPAPVAPRRIELSADALFAFGRSGLGDLQAQGRRELDALAASLRDVSDARLRITGHTDRIGADAANDRLSLARATTVRDYLVRGGVPTGHIQVEGRGEREPKVFCDQQSRQALIDCLAPNRRVEVEVSASR